MLTIIPLGLLSSTSPILAERHKPFGPYHVEPVSKILYPRIGAPVIIKTGSTFPVFLKSDLKEGTTWEATLASPFDKYDLAVDAAELDSNASEWTLTLRVPTSVSRGLYNLTLHPSSSSSTGYSEPNSVFVVGADYPAMIRVGVISDTHYGIRSPFYDLTTRILRRSIDALNAIGLDLIIGAGDMTDATVDEQVFSAFRAEIVRLHVPILMAPGNNDHQSVLRGQYLWEKYLAPNSATLDFGRYHFVMLDAQDGSIPDEQLQWARDDLGSASAGSFKVMVFHFPYWTETSPSLSVEIPKIITNYNVSLSLHGHWHYDDVKLTPTLSIVTTSLSTSDKFVGYRLLNLTTAGVQYAPQSLPYIKLNVTYLQHNDFSSPGGAVLIENGLTTTLDFTLTFLLHNAPSPLDKPNIEGASLVRSTSTKTPRGSETVQVTTKVQLGQNQLVKAYYEPDTTLPAVAVSAQISDSTITLNPVASDVGLGVLSLRVFCSENNSTWVEVFPKTVGRAVEWAFSASASKIYVKAVAVDAAGLEAVRYVIVERVPPITTATTQPTVPSPSVDLSIYVGVIAVLAIVLLSVVALRRRRAGKRA